MPTATAPSLMARLTRRRRRHRPPEPADMGTAFGMEQWLDERGRDQPLAAVGPDLPHTSQTSQPSHTPSAPKTPNPPKRAWWPRWRQGGASR